MRALGIKPLAPDASAEAVEGWSLDAVDAMARSPTKASLKPAHRAKEEDHGR
jgi:hypothetical protein